jgi:protein-disulfide isomerase
MKTLLLLAAAMAAQKPLVEGNPGSAVRVVIYEDLQCPDCANFRVMLDQKLLPRFGAKVAFEHRDFPLPKHKWARDASIASRYFEVSSPELAIKWRQYAMANQSKINPENLRAKLSEWAKRNGIDPEKAIAGLGNSELAAEVDRDYQDGVARGIAHTPTALVNGEPFVETFTYEEISAAIEKALAGN